MFQSLATAETTRLPNPARPDLQMKRFLSAHQRRAKWRDAANLPRNQTHKKVKPFSWKILPSFMLISSAPFAFGNRRKLQWSRNGNWVEAFSIGRLFLYDISAHAKLSSKKSYGPICRRNCSKFRSKGRMALPTTSSVVMDSLHYRKWGGYFKGTKIPDGMETVSGAVVKIMESFISLTPSLRRLRHLLRSSTQWSPLYFFPLGPYLNDVYKIFGILDPPSSAFWPDS